jgi:transcriptional regulator with GAF, ATPase, and Fis domain
MSILYPGKRIRTTDIPLDVLRESLPADATTLATANAERRRIEELLLVHGGNQSAVARELSVPLSTLRYRIRKLGLQTRS